MFGIESLTGVSYAGALVGAVLVEAVVLYVGYGGLQRVLGPAVQNAISGT